MTDQKTLKEQVSEKAKSDIRDYEKHLKKQTETGDLKLDLKKGQIQFPDKIIQIPTLPNKLNDILSAKGLVNWMIENWGSVVY